MSYYHYMVGDGFASKLIVDENGKVKNTYIEPDGSISVGDYDMVPLIDAFVEELKGIGADRCVAIWQEMLDAFNAK